MVVVFAVDDGDGLGHDNEPADRARVDRRGPEDGRVGEKDKRADGDFEPVVLVEAAVPGAELLHKGFGFALAPVAGVGAVLGEGFLSLGFGLLLLLLFLPWETQTAVGGGAAGGWSGKGGGDGGGRQRGGGRRCCCRCGSSMMFCELERRWSGSVADRFVIVVVHAVTVCWLYRLIRMLWILALVWSRSSGKLDMVFFCSKANFLCSLLQIRSSRELNVLLGSFIRNDSWLLCLAVMCLVIMRRTAMSRPLG